MITSVGQMIGSDGDVSAGEWRGRFHNSQEDEKKKKRASESLLFEGATHEKIKRGETPSNLNNNRGRGLFFLFLSKWELEERRGGTRSCEASPSRSVSGRGSEDAATSPRWPTFTWNDERQRCNTANLAIVYSLLRNVNLFALRCAALPLVFVVFSPLLSPFSLVDCSEIKATPLEESEYFRCGERAAFHTTCVALRDRSLLSLRLG